jgi:predicted dehydrogenase
MSRLPFVRIGVIGLGPSWHENLFPALRNDKSRVRVVALYDDLASAARQHQEPLQADVVHSIRALLARQDIDAVMVRHVGWQADWLWDRLREQVRPLWLGPNVIPDERQADALTRHVAELGVIVFPELRLRYLPATLRLQELMATALGAIGRMVIHAHAWSLTSAVAGGLFPRPHACPGGPSSAHVPGSKGDSEAGRMPLSHLLDWCTSLIQCRPVAIEPLSTSPTANTGGVCIVFEKRRRSPRAPEVEIVWSEPSKTTGKGTELSGSPFCEITCEKGSAVMVSRDELHWTSAERSGQEKLASDRTAWEVMLDLFARRVSGGLIPTPDLGDLRRSQALASAVDQVCQTGIAVPLDRPRE